MTSHADTTDHVGGRRGVPLRQLPQLPRLGHILRVLIAQGFGHYVDGLARGFRSLSRLRAGLRELPADVAGALKALARGEARLTLRHERLDAVAPHIERASNRLAFALIIAAVLIGSLIVTTFHTGPHYADIPLIGATGFVIAALLGLWWAIATLRGGRF